MHLFHPPTLDVPQRQNAQGGGRINFNHTAAINIPKTTMGVAARLPMPSILQSECDSP
jgi:hypothetical protein